MKDDVAKIERKFDVECLRLEKVKKTLHLDKCKSRHKQVEKRIDNRWLHQQK